MILWQNNLIERQEIFQMHSGFQEKWFVVTRKGKKNTCKYLTVSWFSENQEINSPRSDLLYVLLQEQLMHIFRTTNFWDRASCGNTSL